MKKRPNRNYGNVLLLVSIVDMCLFVALRGRSSLQKHMSWILLQVVEQLALAGKHVTLKLKSEINDIMVRNNFALDDPPNKCISKCLLPSVNAIFDWVLAQLKLGL